MQGGKLLICTIFRRFLVISLFPLLLCKYLFIVFVLCCVLFLYVFLCAVNGQCPQRLEEKVRSLGTGVKQSCAPSCGCWNTGPSKSCKCFVTAQPSLPCQPLPFLCSLTLGSVPSSYCKDTDNILSIFRLARKVHLLKASSCCRESHSAFLKLITFI